MLFLQHKHSAYLLPEASEGQCNLGSAYLSISLRPPEILSDSSIGLCVGEMCYVYCEGKCGMFA